MRSNICTFREHSIQDKNLRIIYNIFSYEYFGKKSQLYGKHANCDVAVINHEVNIMRLNNREGEEELVLVF